MAATVINICTVISLSTFVYCYKNSLIPLLPFQSQLYPNSTTDVKSQLLVMPSDFYHFYLGTAISILNLLLLATTTTVNSHTVDYSILILPQLSSLQLSIVPLKTIPSQFFPWTTCDLYHLASSRVYSPGGPVRGGAGRGARRRGPLPRHDPSPPPPTPRPSLPLLGK
jgi:hypothetical protein